MADGTEIAAVKRKRKKAEGRVLKKKLSGKKTKKPAKPKLEVKWHSTGHDMIGQKVFTRHGSGEMTAVGYVEGKAKPERFKVKVGRREVDVKATSCRTTAVDERYRGKYAVDKSVRTASGKPSIGVKDAIGEALKGKSADDLAKVAKENDIDFKRWADLNPGMQRMNLGNMLRSRAHRGLRVIVLGKTVVKGAKSEEEEAAKAA